MGEEFSVGIRGPHDTDFAYVCNSWLRGIQRNTFFASRVPGPVFWSHHRPLVEHHLQMSAACGGILIAHPEGDEDTILGWVALERRVPAKPVLHWVYVRSAWRNIGIARKLVESTGYKPEDCVFPVWSFDCNSLVKKFPAEFNPYLHFLR